MYAVHNFVGEPKIFFKPLPEQGWTNAADHEACQRKQVEGLEPFEEAHRVPKTSGDGVLYATSTMYISCDPWVTTVSCMLAFLVH